MTYFVVFVIVLNLVFILPRLAPGNAADILGGSGKFPASAVKLIEIRLGLDKPVAVQYYLYLKGIFATWPPYFGLSYQFYPEPVTYLFGVRLAWSLLLMLSSIFLSLLIAYTLAGITILRRGGKLELGSLYSSILFLATPVFWTGMVFLWIFSVWLGWFPISGNVDPTLEFGSPFLISVIWHSVLPVVVLALAIFGQNYLLLRAAAQEVLRSDYVMAAKTRGFRDRIVAYRYVLRNSLLPVVALGTFSLASVIGTLVLVEAVFGYPGIGELIVEAIFGRDYPVLQGSLFFVTIIVILGGILGDFLLVRLDPRLRR